MLLEVYQKPEHTSTRETVCESPALLGCVVVGMVRVKSSVQGCGTLPQAAQSCCGCPIPGGIQGQIGWGLEQPGIMSHSMAGGWNFKVPSPTILGTSGWRRGDSEQCAFREILEWGCCCARWRDPAAELGVLNAGLGVCQGSLGIRDLDPVAVERYLMHNPGKVCCECSEMSPFVSSAERR